VTAAAPDLIAPVAGFRAWKFVGERLLSPFIPCRWEGPVLHAACFDANRRLQLGRGWLAGPHASPHPDCQCGIYAYHRPGAQAYYGEFEWTEGVVSCWGRLEAHARGLRAEHARVEALARPPAADPRRRRCVEAIARALDVALVERDELAAVAAGLGGPLPERLRPPAVS
jgi:hypothetical protein